MILKLYEVKSEFAFIVEQRKYKALVSRHILDPFWHIVITSDKGVSIEINSYDGPVNNEIVARLIKDNLIWL